jgi:proton-dependent oligopeptide transporter, POT family
MTTDATIVEDAASGDPIGARQPKALYVLMGAELFDRFAYYAFLSVLILFLVDRRGLDEAQAFLVFGAFTSLAALTTLAGGFAADRVFGFGRAIVSGAVLLFAGYGLLAFGGTTLLYAGLAIVITGNGLVHSNLPALLGRFYGDEDERREAGFTYLYMAINLGGFLGPLAMGILSTRYGYGAGFAVAAIAKAMFLVIFLAGRRWLEKQDRPRPDARTGWRWQAACAAAVPAIAVASVVLLDFPVLTAWVLFVTGGGAIGAYVVIASRQGAQVRRRVLAHLLLVMAAVVFWAIYQQYAASVLVFINTDVDRSILDWAVPPSEFASLNPIFAVIAAPLLAWFWTWRATRGAPVNNFAKFAIGLGITGLAFVVLSLGVFFTPQGARTVMAWIVGFHLVLAIGEMCFSPIGFALTSRLAPKELAGFAMGIWYLSIATAYYLSGVIALPVAGSAAGRQVPPETFGEAFAAYGAAGFLMGVVVALLIPRLKAMTAH